MNPHQRFHVPHVTTRSAFSAVIASIIIAGAGLTACSNDDAAVTDGSVAPVDASQAPTQSSDPTQVSSGATAAPAAQPAAATTVPPQNGDSADGSGTADGSGDASGDGSGDAVADDATPATEATPAPNNFVFDLTKDGFGLSVTEVGPDTHFVLKNTQGDTVYDKTFANDDPALAEIIVFPEGAEGDPTQGEVVFRDDAGNEITRFPLVDVLQAKQNSAASG